MVLRSPYPDVHVPQVSLTEYVLGGAAERGDKPALVDGASGAVTTYAEFAQQVRSVAAGLATEGIGPGDAVGLLGPNSATWAVAFHAVVSLGAIVTSINPLLTPDEIAKQLRSADADAVIAAEPLRAAVADTGLPAFALESLPSGDGDPGTPSVDPAGDLAVLPFSSGTTGLSKGVMLTHRNLVANMEQIRAVHRIDEHDVLIGMLPFFHIYGQTVVINLGLSQGATIVTMPRFDMGGFLDLLEQHQVTRAHVAPPVVLGLAKAPGVEGRDLALRVVISGAAPLDADTANRASERLGAPVRQGYGMTEASPVTHFAADEQLEEQDPGAIGRLVGSTEGRLVDPESGEDTDEAGEIWIRGPQVMRGYLADDAATAATLTEDGWLKTGDVARLEDGEVWRIVDRVKELIKYKGYQVPPAELEALLISHPAVADAAVIPVPDEVCGETPKACIVAAGDGARPRRADGVGGRARRALQAHPRRRVRRRDPEVSLGQDHAPAAARPLIRSAPCSASSASSAAAARGTTTTGTGEWRTIFDAREPRKTRATGPIELEPTTSTSPSSHSMSSSASAQLSPWPITASSSARRPPAARRPAERRSGRRRDLARPTPRSALVASRRRPPCTAAAAGPRTRRAAATRRPGRDARGARRRGRPRPRAAERRRHARAPRTPAWQRKPRGASATGAASCAPAGR